MAAIPRKRGEIEEWLRRIFFGGRKEDYVIYVRFRVDGDVTLRPIPGDYIVDIRSGYIYAKDGSAIPFHRVEEIRSKKGEIIYKRGSAPRSSP